MIHQQFLDIKSTFYSKFSNLNVFDGIHANYIKVALDGYRVNYYSKQKLRFPFLWSTFFVSIFYFIKRIKINTTHWKSYQKHLKLAEKNTFCDVFLFDLARYQKEEDGNKVSVHFHSIYTQYKNTLRFYFAGEKMIENYALYTDSFEDRKYIRSCIKHDKTMNAVQKDIQHVYKKIKGSAKLSIEESYNIKAAFQIFFDDFIYWYRFFSVLKPKAIWFMCHYHKEGFMLAAKLCGSRLVEFQHGLIAKSDIFYNFPKSFNHIRFNALMPDKIYTYGNYWSQILVEGNAFKPNQIQELGYYLYHRTLPIKEEVETLESFIAQRDVILVTTQTDMQEYFIEHIQLSMESSAFSSDKMCFIIKIHPSETKQTYDVFKRPKDVLIVDDFSLDVLFQYATIHITIYSTSAFDALRNHVKTYCINEAVFNDYITELENIISVERINKGEIPKNREKLSTQSSDHFFKKPSIDILQEEYLALKK